MGLLTRRTVEPDGPERPDTFNVRAENRTEQDAPSDFPNALDTPDTTPVEYPPLPVAMQPLPPDRENIIWSSGRYGVNGDRAVRLAGRDQARRRLVVLNPSVDGDTVYLMREPTTPVEMAVELAGGTQLEMQHNDSVWARCAAGESASISVVSEYVPTEK